MTSLEAFKLDYEHQESIEDFKALKAAIAKMKRKKKQAQK